MFVVPNGLAVLVGAGGGKFRATMGVLSIPNAVVKRAAHVRVVSRSVFMVSIQR
jgi:hypothetical protein